MQSPRKTLVISIVLMKYKVYENILYRIFSLWSTLVFKNEGYLLYIVLQTYVLRFQHFLL